MPSGADTLSPMDTSSLTVTLYSPNYELDSHADEVWDLLALADKEFVPPLSSRSNTTDLVLTRESLWGGPISYFDTLMTQYVLLAEVDGQTVGLTSFITHFDHPCLPGFGPATYCTTTVVAARFRRMGIANALNDSVESLPPDLASEWIARRTWSTNVSHIELLLGRGFNEVVRLPDDRGPGIDTLYFARRTDPEAIA